MFSGLILVIPEYTLWQSHLDYFIRIAANITIGIPLSEQTIPLRTSGNVCKSTGFPIHKACLDPAPGPEMKSTVKFWLASRC